MNYVIGEYKVVRSREELTIFCSGVHAPMMDRQYSGDPFVVSLVQKIEELTKENNQLECDLLHLARIQNKVRKLNENKETV